VHTDEMDLLQTCIDALGWMRWMCKFGIAPLPPAPAENIEDPSPHPSHPPGSPTPPHNPMAFGPLDAVTALLRTSQTANLVSPAGGLGVGVPMNIDPQNRPSIAIEHSPDMPGGIAKAQPPIEGEAGGETSYGAVAEAMDVDANSGRDGGAVATATQVDHRAGFQPLDSGRRAPGVVEGPSPAGGWKEGLLRWESDDESAHSGRQSCLLLDGTLASVRTAHAQQDSTIKMNMQMAVYCCTSRSRHVLYPCQRVALPS